MRIWIIWWWASGMAISSFLSEMDLWWNEVYLIEKNDCLGKKVLITWWWRCNLSNALKNRKEYLSKYIRWWDLVFSLFEKFSPKKTLARFENNWLKLKIEDNFRVFPVSDKSQDVVRIFERNIARNNKINVRFWQQIEDIKLNNNKFLVNTNTENYEFDCLVIATWWNAYSKTWSSWDGYYFARQLWHHVTKLSPSLTSFDIVEGFFGDISGIQFENAWIVFWNQKINWSLIFTHDRISGPLTFALSAYLAHEIINEKNKLKIKFIPNSSNTYEFYNSQIQELINIGPTKQLKNILVELLPKRFVSDILPKYSIDINKTWANFSKEERKKLCHLLSEWLEITLIWRKNWDEFVTAWWVSLDEINYDSMESKLVKNLYFAWEILDVDAVTWWFNLQFCWSGARVIADNITKSCI